MAGLEMKYFTLRPKSKKLPNGIHDMYAVASRAAMRAYADIIESVNPDLSVDLWEWADKEEDLCT